MSRFLLQKQVYTKRTDEGDVAVWRSVYESDYKDILTELLSEFREPDKWQLVEVQEAEE